MTGAQRLAGTKGGLKTKDPGRHFLFREKTNALAHATSRGNRQKPKPGSVTGV